jgi:hypothetical protein
MVYLYTLDDGYTHDDDCTHDGDDYEKVQG